MNKQFVAKQFFKKSIRTYSFFVLFSAFITIYHISWSQEYPASDSQNSLGVGIGIGTYMPTNTETKKLYGSNWFNFNISPILNSNFNDQWVLGGDLDILTRSSNNNRVLAIKLGLSASKQFGSELDKIIPYVALTGGPVYYDYAFKRLGTRIASKRGGVGASIEFGVKIQKNLVFNGKYSIYNAPDKLNLNGFSLNLLYKIL